MSPPLDGFGRAVNNELESPSAHGLQPVGFRSVGAAMPTTTCPYCNAAVPVSGPPVGTVPCPRCGEDVPLPLSAVDDDIAAAPASQTSNVPPAEQRPSNWAVARWIVAGMLLLATLTLVYALATTPWRRANDTKGAVEPGPVAELPPLPPAQWPGLGYLPDDTHAVAGVRLAAALESDAGRALLAQLNLTPDAGRSQMLGLTPSDVEHLLLAASLHALPPRLTAVVRTRRTLDAEQVRAALQAGRPTDHNGKPLSHGKLWPGGPEGTVWFPDRHTLVAALLPDAFDKIPATPQPDLSRFPAPLPELLRQHVEPEALVWLVAETEPNNPTLAFLTGLLSLPPAERNAWDKLESLAIGVRAEGSKLALSLWLRGRDEPATAALADALERSLGAAGVVAERAKAGDGMRLTATADAAKLAGWVGQMRGGTGK
jgi:hypothetical protein